MDVVHMMRAAWVIGLVGVLSGCSQPVDESADTTSQADTKSDEHRGPRVERFEHTFDRSFLAVVDGDFTEPTCMPWRGYAVSTTDDRKVALGTASGAKIASVFTVTSDGAIPSDIAGFIWRGRTIETTPTLVVCAVDAAGKGDCMLATSETSGTLASLTPKGPRKIAYVVTALASFFGKYRQDPVVGTAETKVSVTWHKDSFTPPLPTCP